MTPTVTVDPVVATLAGLGVVTVLVVDEALEVPEDGKVWIGASEEPSAPPVGWSLTCDKGRWSATCYRPTFAEHPLHPGHVVSSAVVTGCVPIGSMMEVVKVRHGDRPIDGIFVHPDGSLWRWTPDPKVNGHENVNAFLHASWADISDQLAYQSFPVGSYALLLSDGKLTTERCPECWGTGGEGYCGDAWGGAPWTPCERCWPRDEHGEFVGGVHLDDFPKVSGSCSPFPLPTEGER